MTTVPEIAGPSRRSIVLSVAFAAAAVAAAAFVVRVLFIRYLAQDFANLSRDYLWMTPLGYLLLFAAVAVPVGVVARFLEPSRAAYAATWAFTTLVVFDFMMPFTVIGRFPAFVLAAGAGTLVARRAMAAWDRLPRVATASGALLLAPLFVAGLFGKGTGDAPQGSAAAGAPNVLLIILDTVRADELGTYGYSRPTTPSIDSLAARSVVFESAIATAPWTLPSHGGMFTGRYAATLNADYKAPLDRRDSTLAEMLGRRGYETVGVVGNVAYASWESGLARGFHEYFDFQRSFEQVMKSTHLGRTDMSNQVFRASTLRQVAGAVRRLELQETPRPPLAPNTAEYITDTFLGWHAARDTTRPYFAFLNYYDAHDPYTPIEPYRARFRSGTDGNEDVRDLYDAEVNYLDQHLGRLIANLEAQGALRNTLVIVTADHGEHFGERNQMGHFNSIYAPLLWVPLIMRFDGRIPAGQRVAGEVSLRDLGATILDLAGLKAAFPGTSLAGRWAGAPGQTSPAVASYNVVRREGLEVIENGMLSMVRDGWQYILTGKKEFEELYRYRADPKLLQNEVGSDSGRILVPEMRNAVRKQLSDDRGGAAAAPARNQP